MRFMIAPTSCRCGGNWAWLKEVHDGCWEMIGCICHHPPPEEVRGNPLEVVPQPPRILSTEEVVQNFYRGYGYTLQPKPTEPPKDGLEFEQMVREHGGIPDVIT